MKKKFSIKLTLTTLAMSIFLPFLLGVSQVSAEEDKINVISSFSILTDMIESIGGEHVNVHNLVPIGNDPHEYEPLPDDIKAVTDADLFFYNGLNLEGSEDGWFMRLMHQQNIDEDKIIEVAKKVEPMYLDGHEDEAGQESAINPHAFIDPAVGVIMAEAITEALVKALPDSAEEVQKRGDEYIAQIQDLLDQYVDKIGGLPEEDKIFIASEQAFQYLTKRLGLKEGYIWAIDTEENGSPEQITSAIKFVKENNPKVLFVESNVDRRPMETVSKESGVPIYEKPIFSDEIGKKGEPGDTYIKYLEYNLEVLQDGLTRE